MSEKDDILQEALEVFKQCEENEQDNRADARDDIEFARLGKQWTAEDLRARQEDHRPCLTINKLPPFIRQVVNDSRQNSPAISARPVDSKADVRTAEIITGLIRDIESQSDADAAYDTAIDSAATCGFGYFRINLEYATDDSFETELRIARVANPFSIYGDPYSEAPDSSDWNIAFATEELSRNEYKRRFPDASETDFEGGKWIACPDTWKKEKQVKVAEYWKRSESKREVVGLSNGDIVGAEEYLREKALWDQQGITVVGSRMVPSFKVKQYLMSGAEILEETDWVGKYIPIVPVYGEEVNLEGKRYFRSLIRDAKDPQRMFNYWRTASTELVALAPKAPFIGKSGAFNTDAEKWTNANTKSYPFIEYDGDVPPQRQAFAGVPAGALQEALTASDDMKAIIGIYDSSLGARSNETSGKAINARKRESDVSTFHFIDNLSRAVRHGGRILVDLIPKVYTTPRVIRTLALDGKAETVQVNLPFDDKGVSKIYDLTMGKYDVAVKAGPSYTTQREEAAEQMMELIRVFPDAAPVVGDIIAEKLDWPGAQEIAKRLKTLLPPQLQEQTGENGQPGPQQPAGPDPQMMKMIEQGKALIEQLQKEVAEKDGELKALKQKNITDMFRVRIDAYEAETARMQAMGDIAVDRIQLDTEQAA